MRTGPQTEVRSWKSIPSRYRRIYGCLLKPSVLGFLVAFGCDSTPVVPMDLLRGMSPVPAQIPPSPTNTHADDPRAAALGQRFFFDKAISGPLGVVGASNGLGNVGDTGKVSCNSCHDANAWFVDTRSSPNNISAGAAGYLPHNAPTLVNSSFRQWFNTDGFRDSQWMAGATAFETPKSENSSRCTLAHRIYNAYRDDYDAIFTPKLDPALDPTAPDAARFPSYCKPKKLPTDPDGAWEMMQPADQFIVNTIVANYGKTLEAYLRRLVSRDSPFDRFVGGDANAISAKAQWGAELFVGKAGCSRCHFGPMFTDDLFHNLGVPQTGANVPALDPGRYGAIPTLLNNAFNTAGAFSDDRAFGMAKIGGLVPGAADMGAFRTPSLRHVAETAPYMHNGVLPTLESVIDFLDVGGGMVIAPPPSPDGGAGGADGGASDSPMPVKDSRIAPLGLTAKEKAALVEFLKTLSGHPIPAELTTDTSAP